MVIECFGGPQTRYPATPLPVFAQGSLLGSSEGGANLDHVLVIGRRLLEVAPEHFEPDVGLPAGVRKLAKKLRGSASKRQDTVTQEHQTAVKSTCAGNPRPAVLGKLAPCLLGAPPGELEALAQGVNNYFLSLLGKQQLEKRKTPGAGL